MEICTTLSEWRLIAAQFFPGIRLAETESENFHVAWSTRPMGDMSFYEFSISPPITMDRHAEGRNADAPPIHSLLLVQSGVLRHRQFGRLAVSNTQVLTLVDGYAPYTASQSENFHSLVVTVPTAILQRRYGDLRPACITPRSANFGSGSVLWNFVLNIWQRRDEILPEEFSNQSAALLELMGFLFLSPEGSPLRILDQNRTRLLDYISANLPDPDLSVSSIAAALGLSTRHVHTLMENTGKTLARYILEQRLELCMTALRNPLLSHLTIAEIACQWGFSDMSHFGRVFRRRYGESPRTSRQYKYIVR